MLSNTGYDGPAAVPLGDLAGGAEPHGAIDMHNPLGDSPAVVAEGKRLFIEMNCAGCHGYTGGGGMGPPLNDAYWRYGGAPCRSTRRFSRGVRKACPPGACPAAR